MKRTKHINHASFRKSWNARHLTPVALAVTTIFMLTSCEQSDKKVSMYQNADDCSNANPSKSAQCNTTFNNAKKEGIKTAPKYANREDCIAEFGKGQCQQISTQKGVDITNAEYQSSGSWIPLMAGYMMGRMTGNSMIQQQPLFSSKNPNNLANGKFVDASGKNYGPTTTAPNPVVTNTVTRGGFGESIAKQANMAHNNAAFGSSRSFGGGGGVSR